MTRQSDALRDRLGRWVQGAVQLLATELVRLLRERTPIDTGQARASWIIVPGPAGALLVVSEGAPYIRYLNLGSSSQAPAGFVEACIPEAIAIVEAQHGQGVVRAGTAGQLAAGAAGNLAAAYSPLGDA